MNKNELKTEIKRLQMRYLFSFLHTKWLLIFLLMIGCVVTCKKSDWEEGKVGKCHKVLSTNPISIIKNTVLK